MTKIPIEFRFWHKEQRRMGYLCLSEGTAGFGDPSWFDNTEVMQFTGLLDKNGTKIFEGDILKTAFPNSSPEVAPWVSLVEYKELQEYDYPMGMGFELPDSPNTEVIGNIYQNPELIN